MGLTCLQNNNVQQTSFPGELEPICHREPYFGPILPWGNNASLKDLGPFALRNHVLDLFCLGQQCFPQGLGPICPKKVATPLLFKEVEETSHSPLKSCKSFSFWKNLLMKLPKDYILFFPLKMRIWKKKNNNNKKTKIWTFLWNGSVRKVLIQFITNLIQIKYKLK